MDLYALLGVTRAASEAEIERAYRRLSRRYHPGINPGDRVAEQTYKEIQEAYRILMDAERRRAYDRGVARAASGASAEVSVAFEGFDFSAPAEGPLAATFSELFADVFQRAARDATAGQGADIELPLRVSFVDAIRGVDAVVSVTRRAWCPACDGQGHVRRAAIVCQVCQGTGQRRWARGHMVFSRTCDGCGGEGHLAAEPCRACRGARVVSRTEVVTIRVPAGIENGARIVVPGRGHVGAPGGGTGDLYIKVEVAEHPFFRREGRDLYVTLPIGVHEAALGAVVDVPTPLGPAQLRIPPGTASGQLLTLREHGVGGTPDGRLPAGDLFVEVQVALPVTLDERSAELLREFGQRNDMTAVRRAFFEQE